MILATYSPASQAGVSEPQHADCAVDSSGAGRCTGTLAAFRRDRDTRASAQFNQSSDSGRYFYANLNGRSYSCRAPDDMNGTWPIVMTSQPWFNIMWTANGECWYLDVRNHSWEL